MIAGLTAVICFVLHATVGNSMAAWNTVRAGGLQQKLKYFALGDSMIILDGDNIRGKTRFKLSKEELCMKVEEWISTNGMYGKVTLMYDHATQHSGYFISKSGLAVVFSGPSRTADDVISRDIPWLQRVLCSDVTVITEDCGLKRRCKRNSRGSFPEKYREVSAPITPAIGTTSDENKIEMVDEKLKSDKTQKQLHFVGSLPFANMIMNIDISESQLLNGTTDASSTDDDTYVRAHQEIENLDADKISISDRDPRNVPGNVLSSEDLIVIRSNTLLISRRKEDELRIQLAGIQAAISKSKKNIAPKLYVRIKEIKRKINALEVLRDSIIPNSNIEEGSSDIEEGSSQGSVMEEEITVDSQSEIIYEEFLQIESTNLQQNYGLSDDQNNTPSATDIGLNNLEKGIVSEAGSSNVTGADDVIENDIGNISRSGGKNKENKKKLFRTVIKLKEKNNREEFMLKKADALLDKINIKVGVEGRPIEQTWERVILAEKMRIDLSRYCINEKKNDRLVNDGEDSISCGERYVDYINSNYCFHRVHQL